MGVRKPSLRGLRGRTTPLERIVLLTVVAYWMVAGAVLAADPYDIYPWGLRPRLDPHEVTGYNKYLIDAAAKSPDFDLVMVGSSTALPYTAADLRAAFPDAKRPMNFSYAGARPLDRDRVLDALARHTQAKRVIVWFDGFYTAPSELEIDGFPAYLYDEDPTNDLRMVNPEAIIAAINTVQGKPVSPDTSAWWDRRERRDERTYRAYQGPRGRATARELLAKSDPRLANGPARACEQFGALNDQLLPRLRALAARGVTVDLIIPAYSVLYFHGRMQSEGAARQGGTTADLLSLRRCMVQGVADIPGVSVWALDQDVAMISDLANFRDEGHLYGDKMLTRALQRIGDPAYRVTMANVDEDLAKLRQVILNYRYLNSNFPARSNP